MRDPAQDNTQRLDDLAQRLLRTIGIAKALVRAGRQLDLAGIDDGVGALCAQVLDMPREQGCALLGLLHEVLAAVDALSDVLRQAERDGAGRENAG